MNQRIWTIGPYDPCPCGSGKKFKFCHRDVVKAAGDPVLLQMHRQQADVDTFLGLSWIDVKAWMRRYPHEHQPAIVCYPTQPEYWPPLQAQVEALRSGLPILHMGSQGQEVPGNLDGQGMKILLTQRHEEFWGLYVGFSEAIDRLAAVADLGDGGAADLVTSRGVEFYQEVDLRLPEDEMLYWLYLVRTWGMAVLTVYPHPAANPLDAEQVTRVYVPAEQVLIRYKDDKELRVIGWDESKRGISWEAFAPGHSAQPVISWGRLEWTYRRVGSDNPNEQFVIECQGQTPGAPRILLIAMQDGDVLFDSPDLPQSVQTNDADMVERLDRGDAQTVRAAVLGYLGTLRRAGLWQEPTGTL